MLVPPEPSFNLTYPGKEVIESFFQDKDLGHKCSSQKPALGLVVTEELIVREAVCENPLVSCNLIYPFANVGTFSEEVLKRLEDVVMRATRPSVSTFHPCVERPGATLFCRYRERLKYTIALHNDLVGLTDHRLIERM